MKIGNEDGLFLGPPSFVERFMQPMPKQIRWRLGGQDRVGGWNEAKSHFSESPKEEPKFLGAVDAGKSAYGAAHGPRAHLYQQLAWLHSVSPREGARQLLHELYRGMKDWGAKARAQMKGGPSYSNPRDLVLSLVEPDLILSLSRIDLKRNGLDNFVNKLIAAYEERRIQNSLHIFVHAAHDFYDNLMDNFVGPQLFTISDYIIQFSWLSFTDFRKATMAMAEADTSVPVEDLGKINETFETQRAEYVRQMCVAQTVIIMTGAAAGGYRMGGVAAGVVCAMVFPAAGPICIDAGIGIGASLGTLAGTYTAFSQSACQEHFRLHKPKMQELSPRERGANEDGVADKYPVKQAEVIVGF